jgi:hypothetical protein
LQFEKFKSNFYNFSVNFDMPRKYTKRSEYWEKFKKNEQPIENLLNPDEEFSPELIGDSIYSSTAASRLSAPTNRTAVRTNRAARGGVGDRFSNIKDGILPFNYESDSADASFVKKHISISPTLEEQLIFWQSLLIQICISKEGTKNLGNSSTHGLSGYGCMTLNPNILESIIVQGMFSFIG